MVAKNVSVIPAKPRLEQVDNAPAKLRVAAYCRVSTSSDEQLQSYEAQVNYYNEYISKNPEWEMAGIYADEGISGTNTKKRTQFNKMIEDCMDDKIDMIVTKSISRFARNTVDTLNHIRQLRDKNIAVYFEKESINSLDSKGEILLTVMSSLAQEESRSLSMNIKLGFQFRYQQGEVMVNHNRFLGYTKDENKKLVIDPKEAETVRRIFREYLEGASLINVCDGLMADGILTGAGKTIWRTETLRKILRNEKYMGDALLQKTYTVDFLNKKRVHNNSIMPQYYVENSHEGIISRDIFMRVQEELARRANLHSGKRASKRHYSPKHALTFTVKCGRCGDVYRRINWSYKGNQKIVWRCIADVIGEPEEKCGSSTISEEELQNVILTAINRLITNREQFAKVLTQNIKTVLGVACDLSAEELDERLLELQHEMLELTELHAKAGADSTKYDQEYERLAKDIQQLRFQKQNLQGHNSERLLKRTVTTEMLEFLENQSFLILKYNDSLVRKYVENVRVFEDKVLVEFKSGVETEVAR